MGLRADVVCGVDIGSTNVKVVAVDSDGAVVQRAAMSTPRLAGGTVDAEDLFHAIEGMLIDVAGALYAVHAVSCAGVGEDGVLVDDQLSPLVPALPWFHPDRPALWAKLEPLLEDVPELPVASDAARTVVGWAWARAQPGSENARHWLALTDFPAAKWAGVAVMADTLATRTSAWIPRKRTWVYPRVYATLGDAELLPDVLPTGQVLGELKSPRLQDAGILSPDAVVVLGGHDHPIGGWGVHRMKPGSILDSMGTAEVVVAQSPDATVPRSELLAVGPAIQGDGTTLLAVQELARNVAWASENPVVGAEIRYLITGRTKPTASVNSDAFMPGIPGGGAPRYVDGFPHDPASRASAVLGCLARAGARCVREVASHMAHQAPVYAAGGWARSPGWLAIKASAVVI
jgi:sugar (pentulose or hexulose) kinase